MITNKLHDHFSFIYFFFNLFFFITWRLITLQYCSGFCHTLKWISHGFTCVPHPDPPSHLLLHPIPLGLPSAPGLSACLMHAWSLFTPVLYFLTFPHLRPVIFNKGGKFWGQCWNWRECFLVTKKIRTTTGIYWKGDPIQDIPGTKRLKTIKFLVDSQTYYRKFHKHMISAPHLK